MSGFSTSTSFFKQDQSWFTSQASTSATALAATTTALFSTPSSAASSSSSSSGTTSSAESSLLGPVGLTLMNASTGAAVLAAQEASDRTAKQTAALKSGQPTTSALNVSTQVTFSGALSANFGTAGPSEAGGFQFQTGSALQAAFKAAVTGLTSNGDAIDTVAVTGNTLTASTSGTNAHPVFTLSLKPDSGLYTFTLDNPIDQKISRLDQSSTLDLSGLVQAVQSDGGTIALPNSAVIQVHNGVGAATGTASSGAVYEGGLAYTGPDNTPAPTTPAKPTPYSAPINPLTGNGYSAAAGAAAATFGASSVLTLA
jgi:hypothetical protein